MSSPVKIQDPIFAIPCPKKRAKQGQEPPLCPSPCTPPSPSLYRNPSTLLKDISEFKTPKRVFPKKTPETLNGRPRTTAVSVAVYAAVSVAVQKLVHSLERHFRVQNPKTGFSQKTPETLNGRPRTTAVSVSVYAAVSVAVQKLVHSLERHFRGRNPKTPIAHLGFLFHLPRFLELEALPRKFFVISPPVSLAPSNYGRTKAAARELNVFKLEHSQWSRKAQIKEGRLLKSLSVWLKFLFQNPTSCGCGLSVDGDRIVTQHTRKRDCDSSWPADAAVHKRYCRGWLIRSCLSCQRRATTTIKSAIPHRLLGASSLLPVVCNGCPLNSTGSLYMVVQRYIRGWLARLRYIHGVALVDKSCNLCQENVVRDLQVRAENTEKSNYEGGSIVTHDISAPDLVKAAIVVQRYIRGWLVRLRYIHGVAIVDKSCNLCQESVERDLQVRAAVKIQLAWKNFSVCRSPLSAFCCN
ncbi:hypothetical protein ACFX11_005325 [Malus domestica]